MTTSSHAHLQDPMWMRDVMNSGRVRLKNLTESVPQVHLQELCIAISSDLTEEIDYFAEKVFFSS